MDEKHVKSRCRYDGHEFDNEPERFVTRFDSTTGKAEFSDEIFCSIACANGFLSRSNLLAPTIIIEYHLYLRNKRNISEDIPCAPDPMTLAAFRYDKKGLSIDEFRHQGRFRDFECKVIEKHINRQVWQDEIQKNHSDTFHTVIQQNLTLANTLYQRQLTTGEQLPKALRRKEELPVADAEIPEEEDIAKEEEEDVAKEEEEEI